MSGGDNPALRGKYRLQQARERVRFSGDQKDFERITIAAVRGVSLWNAWREKNPHLTPNLTGVNLVAADLSGINLAGANLIYARLQRAKLRGANLAGANLGAAFLDDAELQGALLRESYLMEATLTGANLEGADLTWANLEDAIADRASFANASMALACFSGASLAGANLRGAFLQQADLNGAQLCRADLRNTQCLEAVWYGANFEGADLRDADLHGGSFVRANFAAAKLSGARVYGVSVWDVKTNASTEQSGLRISPPGSPSVEVDDLEIAQFIYLVLNHKKIRSVLTTLGEKSVLLLGRFSPERKEILEAIAGELRVRGYLPILFDFERAPGQDYTETIMVLAGLSRFIIADFTQPKSVQQEAQAIIPNFKVPFVGIIEEGEQPWSMADDLRGYGWVVGTFSYAGKEALLARLGKLIDLAEQRKSEILLEKNKTSRVIPLDSL